MSSARRSWVRAAIGVAAVAVLFALARLGTHLWAVERAAAWRAEADPADEIRHARVAWRLPPSADDPGNDVTCDVEAIHLDIGRAMRPRNPVPGRMRELPAGVGEPLDAGWLDELGHGDVARERLHRALRCTRLSPAAGSAEPRWGARESSRMLLGETWVRAQQVLEGHPGPPAGESALALVRLSVLREADGEVASTEAATALHALAKVVAARAAGMDAAALGERLDALEASLPGVDLWRAYRRAELVDEAGRVGDGGLESLLGILGSGRKWDDKARLVAGRLLFADAALRISALQRADGALHAAAAQVAADDTRACAAVDKARLQHLYRTWNAADRDLQVGCRVWMLWRRSARAGFALARGALALELARLGDGLYPERLPDDARLGDPFAARALGYEPLQGRRAYRLWSAGEDGIDAGGGADDLLVVALELPAQ